MSLQQAAAAVVALGKLPDFAVRPARCLACGRTNTLITATAT